MKLSTSSLLLGLAASGLVLAVLASGVHLSPPARLDDECHDHADGTKHDLPHVAVCFAEGTDPEYMAEWSQRIRDRVSLDFNTGNRWSSTATNANTGGQGTGITITYSFVPDGLSTDGQASRLFQRMNELFPSEDVWQSVIDSAFDAWGTITGNTYIRVSDDGATWGSPGVLGQRGDVRIAMTNVDGNSGTLAYNQFPNNGDMMFDAAENWGNSAQNYVFLHNVTMHEHGHGLGIYHVCPINTTKLMEPTYSSGFYGAQHDDIRAGQRLYGDNYESNDNVANAFDLGLVADGFVLENVSLDDNSDADFYQFSTQGPGALSITLRPVGWQYLEGPQFGNTCTEGQFINSVDDNNLDLLLRDETSSQIIAQSTDSPPGSPEIISRLIIPPGIQSYVLEVNGANLNQIQLYEIELQNVDPTIPWITGCPLEFGDINTGETVQLNATVVNPPEGIELSISNIIIDGPYSVEPNTPTMLEPNGTLELTVSYTADEIGEATGTLTIEHNAPGGDLTCELSANAVEVELLVLPNDITSFGEVEVGESDSARVVLRAQGNTNLLIESVAISNLPFSISFAGPLELVPGPVVSLYPRFSPQSEDEFTGQMTIEHTGINSPLVINLSGTGIITENAHDPLSPSTFALAQNYPNPFNPSTTIRFSLAKESPVNLTVFDITGREVARVLNETLPGGAHQFEFNAESLPAGVYLYRLRAADFTSTKKMILLK